MKKILPAVLIIILALSGCQSNNEEKSLSPDDITTFDEVIEDGKVEIDGISYDIESVSKSTYKYDSDGNIIERINEYDDRKVRGEFVYNKNDDVVEEIYYSDDNIITTRIYSYEEDLLKEVKVVYEGGLEVSTEYSYEEDKEIWTNYNSDGSATITSTVYKDENGNILKMVSTSPDGPTSTINFQYEDDLLIKATTKENDTPTRITYNEYNNVGDKIMEYSITTMEDLNYLNVYFNEYEYNDKLQPISMTTYSFSSPIEEEDIRNFE